MRTIGGLNGMRYLKHNSGFTLIEILIAIAILSIALLSMASTTVTVIGGNLVSKRVTEATSLAQDTIEFLRNQDYSLGTDMQAGGTGTAADTIANELNDSTANNTVYSSANLFASPDHAYEINTATGVENTTVPVLSSPTSAQIAISGSYLRRVWIIKDNYPIAGVGMKTIIVVVGWVEGGLNNRYVSISTVIAGTRYSGEPGTI
jgi:prepilin-type N-terminal cleavage/methylation domain-containing protein